MPGLGLSKSALSKSITCNASAARIRSISASTRRRSSAVSTLSRSPLFDSSSACACQHDRNQAGTEQEERAWVHESSDILHGAISAPMIRRCMERANRTRAQRADGKTKPRTPRPALHWCIPRDGGALSVHARPTLMDSAYEDLAFADRPNKGDGDEKDTDADILPPHVLHVAPAQRDTPACWDRQGINEAAPTGCPRTDGATRRIVGDADPRVG